MQQGPAVPQGSGIRQISERLSTTVLLYMLCLYSKTQVSKEGAGTSRPATATYRPQRYRFGGLELRFEDAQLHEYETKGYVIIECPFPRELTDVCQAAVDRVAQDPNAGPPDGNKRNHYRLRPQLEG